MTKKHIPLEEIKQIPATCKNCGRTFKNVYSAAGHNGHCEGTNTTQHLTPWRGWSKGKLLHDVIEVLSKGSKFSSAYIKKVILQKELKSYKCEKCGISDWHGLKIVLELDHIDGVHDNNEINNLRLLCPNCHSQTATFRGRNINKGITTVSDDDLLNALKSTSSVRQALIKVGLTPKGGNYNRCYKLLIKNDHASHNI